MSVSPYIKLYTSDFLNGVMDLEDNQIGVYAVIIALIGDKGQPIPEDYQWLARRSGSTTRRCKSICASLAEKGKIEIRDGMIGQARALAEVAKRNIVSSANQSAAMARWHSPELPLVEAETPKKTPENAAKTKDKNDLKLPVKSNNRQNTAKNDDANAFFPSCARINQSPELDITTDQTAARAPAPARDSAKPDKSQASLIDARLIAVAHASGHHPRTDEAIAAAKGFIQRWTDLDIDFDAVAIPAIIEFMSKTDDPMTSSLARFDRIITAKAAKARAKPANAKPIPDPIFEFADEPPIAQKLRKRIAHALGPARYYYLCMPNAAIPKPITLRFGEHGSGVGNIIAIDGPLASRLKDEVSHNQWAKFAQDLDLVDIF